MGEQARRPAVEAWRGYKAGSFALLALEDGDSLLDVGCGKGEDARTIAMGHPAVRVVGVDASEEAVAEAQRLSLGWNRPLEFQRGDAYRLAFEAETFDACRADKVFHHLGEPARALGEMTRVARSGARVVVSDVDYETMVVDAPEPRVTRRIVECHAEHVPSGRVGRHLPALFLEAGLRDVEVVPYVALVRERDEELLKLEDKAERARQAGRIEATEVARWLAALAAADRAGRFLCALTVFTVRGRKP